MESAIWTRLSPTKQVSIHFYRTLQPFLASLPAFLFVASLATSCKEPDAVEREPRIAVRTAEVSTRTLRLTVDYIGTVHSVKEANVLARIPGRVLEIPVQEGEEIEKGDLLARLAAPELSAAHRRTGADVARARAEKNHLCHWAEVHEDLAKTGTISRNQADSSRRACSVAEASLGAASAAAGQTAAEREKSVERGPFDGIVLKRFVETGENMMPGRPILMLGSRQREIRAWVTEADIYLGIAPGTPVLTRTRSGVFRAEVTRVAPRAEGPARLFETAVNLPVDPADNSGGLHFRHGSSISLSFILKEETGTTVPVDAVLEARRDSQEVFVIRDDRASMIRVEEIMRDEEWALVRGPIRDGDTVAVSNVTSLSNGAPVFPVSQVEKSGQGEEP